MHDMDAQAGLSRRALLAGLGGAGALGAFGAAGLLGTSSAWAGSAPAAREKRFVFMFLRGGVDGLTLFPPYKDPHYAQARGELAVKPPGEEGGCADLDGFFGLHPHLFPLLPLWEAKEMLPVQAVGTWLRDRSHFAVQDLVESGHPLPGRRDGWINRLLAEAGGGGLGSLTVNPLQTLAARGTAPADSWWPMQETLLGPGTALKVLRMYGEDPKLEAAFEAGLAGHERIDHILDRSLLQKGGGRRVWPIFSATAAALGRIMGDEGSPSVGFIDNASWDTHVGQTRMHDRLVPEFVRAVLGLKEGLGAKWKDTVVVVASEFGRRVAANSGGGCDHGTGGCALLLGGAVAGGRVLADWPGLNESSLYEKCDLMPTLDLRSVLKGVLAGHFSVDGETLDRSVFPDSKGAKTLDKVIKS